MTAPAWTQPGYQQVAALLSARTGLAFSVARVADAEAGIRRAMARAGARTVSRYLDALEQGDADFDQLIEELTVGETYFFREPLQWEVLRDEVLPELQRARPSDHVLRLWSAGCASGEEAYSLAILLDELGLGERAEILATDISRGALERAAAATYGTWSLRGVELSRVVSHFEAHGPRWRLDQRIRHRVRLAPLNLAAPDYPSFRNGTWRMDVILCRNVFIYFDDDTVERVVRQLAECLAPGGWLLTGASDPVVNAGALEAVTTKAGILYRRPALAAVAPAPSPAPSPPGGEGWREAVVPLPFPSPCNDGHPAPAPVEPSPSPARAALARGDYALARKLAAGHMDPAMAVVEVRALANLGDTAAAQRLAAASSARSPTCVELHLLHAVLLIDLGRHADAGHAARRALYLDRRLVMGHFLLGTALARLGDAATARKAFQNARALCASSPPDLPVPFGDGQRAALLAEAAGAQLRLLGARKVS